jgi:GNAT superfamily N-acetyltransferase
MNVRPASHDDAPRLLRVSNAVDREWWGQPETELDEVEQRLRLAGNLSAHTCVIEVDGSVAGYAVRFARHDTDLLIAPDLDPATRGRVEDALLGWVVETGADRLDVPAQADQQLATLGRYGFVPVWSSFEMERARADLAAGAGFPDGCVLRAFDPDEHASAVHAMLYDFWTEVPSHAYRALSEWRELFLGYAGFDPGLQLVVWQGDEPVGVAICRVHTGELGWVAQLGVAPTTRGRGLGRALLVEATARLQAVPGVGTVGLAVAARNAQALGLYRSVGFVVSREWVTCARVGRTDH